MSGGTADPVTDPVNVVDSRPRPWRALLAGFGAGLLLMAVAAGGFWLGRRGAEQTAGSGAPGAGAKTQPAADKATAEAEKRRLLVQKQIEFLDKAKRDLDMELSEYVLKPMADKELELGDAGGPEFGYESMQRWLAHLEDEKLRLLKEIGESRGRADRLEQDWAAGRTSGEVELLVLNNPRYQDLARRVDEAAARIDELKIAAPAAKAPEAKAADPLAPDSKGPAGKAEDGRAEDATPQDSKPQDSKRQDSRRLDEAYRLKSAAEARLTELRDELRGVYLTEAVDRLRVRGREADLQRIDELLKAGGKQLAQLHKARTEYRILQDRERRLRDQIEALQQRISNLRLDALADAPDPEPFVPSARAGH